MLSESSQEEISTLSSKPIESSIELLSERDAKLLFETGKQVIEQILQDYPDELPGVVFLPDSSARPLKYLISPSFKKVADERGVEEPHYVFIQPLTGIYSALNEEMYSLSYIDSNNSIEEEIKQNIEIIQQKLLSNAAEKTIDAASIRNSLLGQIKYYTDLQKALDAYPEIIAQLVARISKVKELYEAKYHKRMDAIVIDDYAMMSAPTLGAINEAHIIATEFSMNRYVFGSVDLTREVLSDGVYTTKNKLSDSAGVYGFDYRKPKIGIRDAYGVMPTDSLESATVAPDLGDTSAAKEIRIKRMHQLRKDMDYIGRKIAENF